MREIGIRYYDDLLTEENFIAMAEGGMTATEICLGTWCQDRCGKHDRRMFGQLLRRAFGNRQRE